MAGETMREIQHVKEHRTSDIETEGVIPSEARDLLWRQGASLRVERHRDCVERIACGSARLPDMRHRGDLHQSLRFHQAALDAVARRLVAWKVPGVDAVDGGIVRPVGDEDRVEGD